MYTGREYDRGLGLYYNRARYYNPKLGRFISRDPIGIADDVNLYGYVGNSPIGFTDIFGLAAKAFIAGNEGNAWYFDSADTLGSGEKWFNTGHAALYFIYNEIDYLVSFYPSGDNDTNLKSGNNDIFFGKADSQNTQFGYEDALEDFRQAAMGNGDFYNTLEIGSSNLNTNNLYNWYKDDFEYLDQYNTFSNNCSDEVRKGLIAAGVLENRTIYDTLSSAGLVHIDTPLSLRKEVINYLNNQ